MPGRGDQVRFVGAEEIEHRELHLGRADPVTQHAGRKAGQIEEALRPPFVSQDPGKRPEGKSGRVARR